MVSKKRIIFSEKAQEIRKERNKNYIQKIIIRILIFFLAYLLFGFVSSMPNMLIKNVIVSDTHTVDNTSVLKSLDKILAGNILFILPKKNIFFFPKNKIETTLLNEFPSILSVNIKLSNNILSIQTEKRKGEYLWCGNTLEDIQKSADGSICYFVDKDGYIFAKAPYFSGTVFFKFLGGSAIHDLNNPTGSYILPKKEFSEIVKFKEFLPILNIESATFFLNHNGVYELYLKDIKNIEKTPKIIFNSTDDFQLLLNNLTLALNTEPLKSSFLENFDNLLYIDLRFEKQVVYKFK